MKPTHVAKTRGIQFLLWLVLVALAIAGQTHADELIAPTEPATVATAEHRMGEVLRKSIDLKFREIPLETAIEHLRTLLEINIVFDQRKPAENGVTEIAPVTISVAGVSAASALSLLLEPLELDYTIRDEVLYISTVDEIAQILSVRTYDVSDLMLEAPASGSDLLELIVSTIAPSSWDQVGGRGSIHEFNHGAKQALVIAQTRRTHDSIEELLLDLRAIIKNTAERTERDKSPPQGAGATTTDSAIASKLTGSRLVKANAIKERAATLNQKFAFDLYQKLAATDRNSIFISPYSITELLGMVESGAAGKTSEEIRSVLHLQKPGNDPWQNIQSFRTDLLTQNEKGKRELLVANRLWLHLDAPINDSFRSALHETFNGSIANIDFQKPPAAAAIINAWVSEQTGGKITNLIDAQAIDTQLTKLMLTNAVYFKAAWAKPFDANLSRQKNFFGEERTTKIKMMELEDFCRHGVVSGVEILEKPYADGRMSMVILLPQKNRLKFAELEASLSAENLAAWLPKLHSHKVGITLPKFSFTKQMELQATLESLGMTAAFDRDSADFSRISSEKIAIDKVVHQAFVEVNELGTEAAAATNAGGYFGGAFNPKLTTFSADRPFVFLIRDQRTSTILFIGRYMGPDHGP